MNPEEIKRKSIYCNCCKRETNHVRSGLHQRAFYDEDTHFREELIYSLWICAGCDHGTMEQAYSNDALEDSRGEGIYEYEYFPKRDQSSLQPKRFLRLKPRLQLIYEETIKCYNEGALVLCSAGIRTLLEGICQGKRVGGPNLKSRWPKKAASESEDHQHASSFPIHRQ